MIFVTVGTHEQQFNRLVKYMDELAGSGKLDEEVIIQTGYSDYIPKYAKHSKFYSYDEMQKYYKDARIIITHGGPSSFIPALQLGKTPIVVPRQKKFNEHVNDHQAVFCKKISDKFEKMVVILDIMKLDNAIVSSKNSNNVFFMNNISFNIKFNDIVNNIYND